ncbi:MAG: hypothetical protein H0U54_09710 [Acidobacteria bacterium]|nr:hypothetical protein [Acidobacteriota bacterium]
MNAADARSRGLGHINPRLTRRSLRFTPGCMLSACSAGSSRVKIMRDFIGRTGESPERAPAMRVTASENQAVSGSMVNFIVEVLLDPN